mmetsp:Transcript_18515/g.41150  ORF Transcript_18515/g.41150 Transcript_18515/m.41150 type:complete len:86 (+) Transcript_18515:127-384(+)
MGIRCALSRGLALGFHTGKGVTFGGASYDTGPSSTGVGHFHFEKVRMNMRSSVDAVASSFLTQTQATNIAQFTPPRKPSTLEYSP